MVKKGKKPPAYILAWERAVPCPPKNHIISSDYTNKGEKCHFHASYEKEEVNMTWLLSFQYARVWEQEKIIWDEQAKKGNEQKKTRDKKKPIDVEKVKERQERNNAKKPKAVVDKDKKKKKELPKDETAKTAEAQNKAGIKIVICCCGKKKEISKVSEPETAAICCCDTTE